MKEVSIFIFLILSLTNCQLASKGSLFQLRANTGINFNNEIIENDTMNIMALEYFYRGGGVAIGDLNNDLLPDVIMGGNMVHSRCYLNKGNFTFKDITTISGLLNDRWINGISLVDINKDGLLDIYLCVGGTNQPESRKNLFYIQQKNNDSDIPIFVNKAKELGLDSDKSTTQAVFFDYDLDNDLDVIIVNTDADNKNPNSIRNKVEDGSAPNSDLLFENRLNEPTFQKFVDVSLKAGIKYDGFSLGVSVTDINMDGWPDIYIANDHLSNDILYINNGDKFFSNQIVNVIKNQSYYSMGVYSKDLDNNALNDIFTLDMLPASNERRHKMLMGMNLPRFRLAQDFGYQHQFMKNTLQMNIGINKDDNPIFTETAQFAGIHDTDWSWGSVIADFNLDGLNDIIITNGYARDITDMDFVVYQENLNFFNKNLNNEAYKLAIAQQPPIKLGNYAFMNKGSLLFTDVSETWGINTPNLSNGIAYGDLDLDGDLDLVINHINQKASILENTTKTSKKNFIKVLPLNSVGAPVFGVKAFLYIDHQKQYQELFPVQGYQSTQEPIFHFGINQKIEADSLKLIWPGGGTSLYYKLQADSLYTIREPIKRPYNKKQTEAFKTSFFSISNFRRTEAHLPYLSYTDIENQSLIFQTFSKEGPKLVIDDEDLSQRPDIFVGTGPKQNGLILHQNKIGEFEIQTFEKGGEFEDMDAEWLDADGDNDLDLFVSSGNVNFLNGHKSLQDRLYLRTKNGFEWSPECIPILKTFTKEVVKVDFDHDNDDDLIVFGRMVNGKFPAIPKSYLLQNNKGVFTDVSERYLPQRGFLGMVSCAEKADLDNDGTYEIIFAGEWQSIRVLKWDKDKYNEVSEEYQLSDMKGLWHSIHISDLNKDGFMDILAGNAGKNHPFAKQIPLQLYVKDLDNDGNKDPLLAWNIINQQNEKKFYPVFHRDAFTMQFPFIKTKYRKYDDFAKADMASILTLSQKPMHMEEVNFLESVIFINEKGKGFSMQKLPKAVQMGPVTTFLTTDFNMDGETDILCMGNTQNMPVFLGWNNNSLGTLVIKKKGVFEVIPNNKVQLYITGEVRAAI
ncbi:MAG: VCBS repeat-containing protein, partial [Bacteroidota bacterium]